MASWVSCVAHADKARLRASRCRPGAEGVGGDADGDSRDGLVGLDAGPTQTMIRVLLGDSRDGLVGLDAAQASAATRATLATLAHPLAADKGLT